MAVSSGAFERQAQVPWRLGMSTPDQHGSNGTEEPCLAKANDLDPVVPGERKSVEASLNFGLNIEDMAGSCQRR